MSSVLRVILVEDSPSTRKLLRVVLDTVRALEVVAETATGKGAVDLAGRHQPDVILLDLGLADTEGAVVLPELRRVAPAARVVILSNNARLAGPDLVTEGAVGYIEKGLPPTELVAQLARVLHTPLRMSGVMSNEVNDRFRKDSPR